MIRFECTTCGRKLKAAPEDVGGKCKCTSCGNSMRIPAASTRGEASEGKARWISGRAVLAFAGGIGTLAMAAVLALVFLTPSDLDRRLDDLKTGNGETRNQAVIWLAEADVQPSQQAKVTAALEPILFEGDVHRTLNPSLVLRAYLHWAGSANVPALLRLVDNPTLHDWSTAKTGQVMDALGKLADQRAIEVLARRLSDRHLHDHAINALKMIGPSAEGVVIDYVFDPDADTRARAGQLLADFGTKPEAIAGAALRLLASKRSDDQRAAAAWFVANPPPVDGAPQTAVAGQLVKLLDDPAPRANAVALHALKTWATKESLPELVKYAEREGTVAASKGALIDLLSQFPDESTADAIALQLKDPTYRAKAVQALAKIGPAAAGAVLPYINHRDADVQRAARHVCQLLNIPEDGKLDQVLADVADARRSRSRAALHRLALLRPDDADREKVSKALNAPLLDTDPAIRVEALNAVAVWGTRENTATLLKVLGRIQTGGPGRDCRVVQILGMLQDPAAATALAEGLTDKREAADASKALQAIGPGAEPAVIPYLESDSRLARFEACRILAEIGTSMSIEPLAQAGVFFDIDGDFNRQTRIAVQKIEGRKK